MYILESKLFKSECEELPRNEMETSQSKATAKVTFRPSQSVAGKPDLFGY